MSSTEAKELGVQVAKDQMSAIIQIPAGFPTDILTAEVCAAQFEANGVVLTTSAEQMIQDAVSAYLEDPSDKVLITIVGQPPVTGDDGSLELTPECRRLDPGELAVNTGEVDETDQGTCSVDHYARSPYILIECDQVIGRIVTPTEGVDGVDVLGNAVAARPGKSFIVKPHESVLIDANNNLIAQSDGILEHLDNSIRVNKLLNIDGCIDFETGNVDFDGDILVAKGVCDNFKVCATHSAVINGVVEAAEIKTGVDLTLVTGMFGKDKGTVQVGHDCRAKFLQQTRGEISGDLMVDKEIMNCDLIVGGGVDSPHASLVGGSYHCLGAATLKNIGSDTGVRTVLHIGSSPAYNRLNDSAIQKLDQLENTLKELTKKLEELSDGPRSKDPQAKEEITEIWCEQLSVQEEYDNLKRKFDKVTENYNANRCAEVAVISMIFPETVLVLGHSAAKFIKPLHGPVKLFGNQQDELCYRRGVGDPALPLQSFIQYIYKP